MPNESPSMLRSALIAGAIGGSLAGLPLIECLCCLLMIGSGMLAAYLYSRQSAGMGLGFSTGQGALLGAATAPVYAFLAVVVGGIMNKARGLNFEEQMEEGIQQAEDSGMEIPPEAEPIIDWFIQAGPILLGILGFLFYLVLGLVFCVIGGLIGGAIFKSAAPTQSAPPTVDV